MSLSPAKCIRYILEQEGLTQREAARMLQIGEVSFSQALTRDAGMSVRAFERYVWALGWELKMHAEPRAPDTR